jgi:hypothetical protein
VRHDRVPGAGEIAVLSELVQAQFDAAGQEGRASAERDRGDRDDDLVEQLGIGN